MTYETVSCAYCPNTIQACRQGESDKRGPAYCASKLDAEWGTEAIAWLSDPDSVHIAQVAARVEAEGYCRWSRVEEICQFAKRMAFTRVGIATCITFIDLAHVFSAVLESHGFAVASVACKTGGAAKEAMGLADTEKVNPGGFEAMCNPIAQAALLNRAGCELNVIIGLCVGHDALFARHSQGLVTTLVAKDRMLAHNPIGALHSADTYYSRIWGPDKPEKLPTKPVEGRKPRL